MIAGLILLAGLGLVPGGLAPQGHCLKAQSALAADSVPLAANFVMVECPRREPAPAFRHDSALGSSRLSRAIAPNEIVPLFPEFGQKLVQPGQVLRIVIFAGAVRIEREVEALQAARPGHRLFVRSNDGQVLSVRYEAQP